MPLRLAWDPSECSSPWPLRLPPSPLAPLQLQQRRSLGGESLCTLPLVSQNSFLAKPSLRLRLQLKKPHWRSRYGTTRPYGYAAFDCAWNQRPPNTHTHTLTHTHTPTSALQQWSGCGTTHPPMTVCPPLTGCWIGKARQHYCQDGRGSTQQALLRASAVRPG